MRTIAQQLSIALVVTVGCGAPASAPASAPAARAPRPPRPTYRVTAVELGDADVLERARHRARLARIGPATLRDDGGPIESSQRAPEPDRTIVPVLGETLGRVRVVADDDGARVALWIDRGDLAATAIVPVELADAGGTRRADAGIWLDPGADIAVRELADAREVTLRDRTVRATGRAPADTIGTIWIEPVTTAGAAQPGAGAPPHARVPVGVALLAEPRDGAATIAETIAVGDAIVLARRDAWAHVELSLPRVRVRGFVRARELSSELGEISGEGHGSGYGMSDTDRFEVAAGTCLFDRASGDVIGATTETQERYGHRRGDWPTVYVGTRWGFVRATAHVVEPAPRWRLESCAR